jgi:hypothetical protein
MSKCGSGFVKKTIDVEDLPEDMSDHDIDAVNEYVYYGDNTPVLIEKNPEGVSTSLRSIRGKSMKVDMCVKKCNNGSFPYENNTKIHPSKDGILGGGNFECRDNASSEKHGVANELGPPPMMYKCVSGVVDDLDPNNPICKYKAVQYPIGNNK